MRAKNLSKLSKRPIIRASFVPCMYRPLASLFNCNRELRGSTSFVIAFEDSVKSCVKLKHGQTTLGYASASKNESDLGAQLEDSKEAGSALFAPDLVQWEVTQRCNLKCLHCYAASGPASQGELDTEESLALIEGLAGIGVYTLHLLGGEPFVRPDITILTDYAIEQGMTVHVSTNGTLISENTVRRLSKNITIDISLDGCPNTHENLRGRKGCYDAAINSLKLLNSYGISTGLCFTANKANYQQIGKILEVANSLTDRLQILALSPVGRGVDIYDELGMEAAELLEIEEKIRRMISINERLYIDAPILGLSSDSDHKYYLLAENPLKEEYEFQFGCAAGMSKCTISCTGDVYPCLQHRVSFGNVRDIEFARIWMWLSENCANSKNCANIDCKYLEICGGHCRTNTERVVSCLKRSGKTSASSCSQSRV